MDLFRRQDAGSGPFSIPRSVGNCIPYFLCDFFTWYLLLGFEFLWIEFFRSKSDVKGQCEMWKGPVEWCGRID